MIRKTLFILILSIVSVSALDVTFTIPDEYVPIVVESITGLDPVPLDTNETPLYTDAQWTRLCIRRWIIKQVRRWKTKQGIKEKKLEINSENLDMLVQ